eukprot:3535963-Amphidinium_carterae.1
MSTSSTCALRWTSLLVWSWGVVAAAAAAATTSSSSTSDHLGSVFSPACSGMHAATSEMDPTPRSSWYDYVKDPRSWERLLVIWNSLHLMRSGAEKLVEDYYVYYQYYYTYYVYMETYSGQDYSAYDQGDHQAVCVGASSDGIMAELVGGSLPNSAMVLILAALWCVAFCITLVACRRHSEQTEYFPWSRCLAAGIVKDLVAILVAVLHCGADIMLIFVARLPLGKRILRKKIMSMRGCMDRAPAHNEDAVFIMDGEEYKPLTFIQRDGGRAYRARWGGKRRFQRSRKRTFAVRHSPTTPGECLFSSFQYVLKQAGMGRYTVKKLRQMVKQRLEIASSTGDWLQGEPIAHWAEQVGLKESEFIDRCVGGQHQRRWGNTLDLHILACLFSINIVAIDTVTGEELMAHHANSDATWCIGLKNDHFTVLKRRCYHSRGPTTRQRHSSSTCRPGGGLAAEPRYSSPTKLSSGQKFVEQLWYSWSPSSKLGYALSALLRYGYSFSSLLTWSGYSLSAFVSWSLEVQQYRQRVLIVPNPWHSLSPEVTPSSYSLSAWTQVGCSLSSSWIGHKYALPPFWSWISRWYSLSPLSCHLPAHNGVSQCVHGGAKDAQSKRRAVKGSAAKSDKEVMAKATIATVPKHGSLGAQVVAPPDQNIDDRAVPQGSASIVADEYKHLAKAPALGKTAAGKAIAPVPSVLTAEPPSSARVRPYPLSPIFQNVQAFPPAHMGEAIEVTAAYAMEFPDPKLFEQKILEDQDRQRFSFLIPGDLYHEYYLAVTRWIQIRKEQSRREAEAQAAQEAPVVKKTAVALSKGKSRPASSSALSTPAMPKAGATSQSKAASSVKTVAPATSGQSKAASSDGSVALVYPPNVGSRKRSSLENAVAA